MLMRSDSQPTVTISYRNASLLFVAVGWAETKQSMNLSMCQKRGTMCVQISLRKGRMVRSPQEIDACTGTHDMKEENIVDESHLVVTYTMSKKRSTSMRKFVKATAPICSTYDEDFKTLLEEHGLGVVYNLCLGMDCVLAELPYNVLRIQKDDHSV